MARPPAALVPLAAAALALSVPSVAHAAKTYSIKVRAPIPPAGDVTVGAVEIGLRGVKGKPKAMKVRLSGKRSGALTVLAGAGKAPARAKRPKNTFFGGYVIVNRDTGPTPRIAQAGFLELVFVGFHRAKKGRLVNSASALSASATAAVKAACKRGSGIFNYALDYLKPKPLLGSLFGGLAAPAIGTFSKKEACDEAYDKSKEFRKEVDKDCPAPRTVGAIGAQACAAPGGGGGGGGTGTGEPAGPVFAEFLELFECHPTPGSPPSYIYVPIFGWIEVPSGRRVFAAARSPLAGGSATVKVTPSMGGSLNSGEPSSKTVTLDAEGKARPNFAIASFGKYTFELTATSKDGRTSSAVTKEYTVSGTPSSSCPA